MAGWRSSDTESPSRLQNWHRLCSRWFPFVWFQSRVDPLAEAPNEDEPASRPTGFDPIDSVDGIVVWGRHKPRAVYLSTEWVTLIRRPVAFPSTIILVCGWIFVVLAVLLFCISIAATELNAASQREHGLGAVVMIAFGVPTLLLTHLYRARWKRKWHPVSPHK